MRVFVGYDLIVVDSYWLERTSADPVKIILRLFNVVERPQKMQGEPLLYHVSNLRSRSCR